MASNSINMEFFTKMYKSHSRLNLLILSFILMNYLNLGDLNLLVALFA